MALPTVDTSTGLPSSKTSPLMRLPYERPKMLIASSVRPEPIRPAMPTISPLRTFRFTPLMTSRSLYCSWCTCQLRTSKMTSPICGWRCG